MNNQNFVILSRLLFKREYSRMYLYHSRNCSEIKMEKEYLIREKPLKALLLFAFPMIIGNLFQQFYTMVDSVVVGRFVGENALAAVGASYSLTNVFISIAIGGGMGASVLTSRYFGGRN